MPFGTPWVGRVAPPVARARTVWTNLWIPWARRPPLKPLLVPFEKIKIDQSFVRSVDSNEQTAAIVRSVLGLGRGLGLPVLAEGVETEAELGFLAAEQCGAAQAT